MIPLIENTVVSVLLYSVDRNPCIFLFSYIFVMIPPIGNTVVRVLLYSVDRNPPVPFNRSLSVHELWCIYQNNICFLKIVVYGFQVAGKAQLYFSF